MHHCNTQLCTYAIRIAGAGEHAVLLGKGEHPRVRVQRLRLVPAQQALLEDVIARELHPARGLGRRGRVDALVVDRDLVALNLELFRMV
jgi:hypothetical protein